MSKDTMSGRRRHLSHRLLMHASELLLAAMVLLIVLPAFADLLFETHVMQGVMEVVLVLASYAFLIRGVKKPWVHWMGVPTLLLALLALALPDGTITHLDLLSEAFTTLLFIIAVAQLFRVLFLTDQVNIQVIISAVSGYLALGLFWALCAYTMERVIPGSYVDHYGLPLDRLAMTYYAYMTMTTVGYGDIEPVLAPARAFSSLMAVSGQMYLAGVMAILVGKFLEKRSAGMKNSRD